MELSTNINAESLSLQKYLCLLVDVARLASKLANGGICGSPGSFVVPEKLFDIIEDYEEKVRVLERHSNYSRRARAAQR